MFKVNVYVKKPGNSRSKYSFHDEYEIASVPDCGELVRLDSKTTPRVVTERAWHVSKSGTTVDLYLGDEVED